MSEPNALYPIDWSVDDVADWLDTTLVMPTSIIASFKEQRIDGPTLLELAEDDLRHLGVDDVIHRKRIAGHLELLRIAHKRHMWAAGIDSKKSAPAPAPAPAPVPSQHPVSEGNGHYVLPGSPLPSKDAQQIGVIGSPKSPFRESAGSLNDWGGKPRLGGSPKQGSKSQKELGDFGAHTGLSGSPPPRMLGSPRSMTSLNSDTSKGSNHYSGNASDSNSFSRISKFINQDPNVTSGLSSCFGLDSPSFSTRGSFNYAPRWNRNKEQRKSGPGPATYACPDDIFSRRMKSPRATIGNSPRDTSENFINRRALGSGKYGSHTRYTSGTIPGGVIPTAPRFGYARVQNDVMYNAHNPQGVITPGPGHYHGCPKMLSTFR